MTSAEEDEIAADRPRPTAPFWLALLLGVPAGLALQFLGATVLSIYGAVLVPVVTAAAAVTTAGFGRWPRQWVGFGVGIALSLVVTILWFVH